MAQITAKAADLGKAMSAASLAVGDNQDRITSHALFTVADGMAVVRATDGGHISFAQMPIESKEQMAFTVNPKNLADLLKTADREIVTLRYDAVTHTLDVFVSDDEEAYVSMPSFDPAAFPADDNMLDGAVDLGTVSSEMLATAFRFQLGCVAQDEKNSQYGNLYIDGGVLFGSNGSTRIGAFESGDFSKMASIIIPRAVLQTILSLADKRGLTEIAVKETDKLVLFSSTDGLTGFGFTKLTVKPLKMPISTKTPGDSDGDSISIDRTMLMKKITRLTIGMRGDKLDMKVTIDGDTFSMKSICDRPSVEKMQCKRLIGNQKIEFLMDCKLTEDTLSLFKIPVINLYLAKNRCTMYSSVEGPDKKPFVSVAKLSLPRDV